MTWVRTVGSQAASPTQADGTAVAPKNVVVLKVHYAGGVGVEGSEAQLTGSGDALCSPRAARSRAGGSAPTRKILAKLVDADGNEIELTPGQTWVELPDVSYAVDVTRRVLTARVATGFATALCHQMAEGVVRRLVLPSKLAPRPKTGSGSGSVRR